MSPSMERLQLLVLIAFFTLPSQASTIDSTYAGWPESRCLTSACLTHRSPHQEGVERGAFPGVSSERSQLPVVLVRCTERIYTCAVMPFGSGAAKVALIFASSEKSRGSSPDAILGCLTSDCPRWDVETDMEEASTGVPEPGTIMLFVTGMAALLTRYKRPCEV